jgi:hypothetical protein
MNNDAFEKAWTELTAPQNETVTSKWYFKKGYEAATKAALGSRVVLPERKKEHSIRVDEFAEGFNDCLDSIKVLPLTAEQLDSLLPSDESLRAECEDHINSCKKRAAVKEETWFEQGFYQGAEHALVCIRESIKKRLAGL